MTWGTSFEKAMLDSQENKKGYFTKEDWIYTLTMLPRQHPLYGDEDEAEQGLYALLEEGKIREIELGSGKFEPTEKGGSLKSPREENPELYRLLYGPT